MKWEGAVAAAVSAAKSVTTLLATRLPLQEEELEAMLLYSRRQEGFGLPAVWWRAGCHRNVVGLGAEHVTRKI